MSAILDLDEDLPEDLAERPAAGGPAADGPPAAAAVCEVMSRHATGVAVVTAADDGPVGFAVTSLVLLSYDPALICFGVALSSESWRTWRCTERGAVHLLHHGQAELARRLGRSGPDTFGLGVAWHWSEDGVPHLEDVLARLDVEPTHRLLAGDHALIVCRVLGVGAATERPALVHAFGTLQPGPLPDHRTTRPELGDTGEKERP